MCVCVCVVHVVCVCVHACLCVCVCMCVCSDNPGCTIGFCMLLAYTSVHVASIVLFTLAVLNRLEIAFSY